MNQDRKDFLSVTGVIPARLDSQETAWFLGFAEHGPHFEEAGIVHVEMTRPIPAATPSPVSPPAPEDAPA